MKEIYDNYSNFREPAALPCFIGDSRRFDVWADGCRHIRSFYDGTQNKEEIVPLVRNPRTLGMMEIGEPYTISAANLQRRIIIGKGNQ